MAGLGFWTRPEVALVPPVVVIAAMWGWRSGGKRWPSSPGSRRCRRRSSLSSAAMRWSRGSSRRSSRSGGRPRSATQAHGPQKPPLAASRGLDDPRFDFSPKEESDAVEPERRAARSDRATAREWAEGISYLLIPVLLWGVIRCRSMRGLGRWSPADPGLPGRLLDDRDPPRIDARLSLGTACPSLIVVPSRGRRRGPGPGSRASRPSRALAWSGPEAGLCRADRAGRRRDFTSRPRRGTRADGATGRPGLWLADKAEPGDAVLDTRGWASFVRGIPGYDYWHVRQALSDRNLKYVVVGTDELKAESRRAATLRAMLAHAGKPVATFSGRRDGRGSGVEVYRFDPPESWEGVNAMTRGHGSLLTRLTRGTNWSWRAERHLTALPADLDVTVMTLESRRPPPRQARPIDGEGPVRLGVADALGLPQAPLPASLAQSARRP